jgi:hypothetical protein
MFTDPKPYDLRELDRIISSWIRYLIADAPPIQAGRRAEYPARPQIHECRLEVTR